LNCDTYVPNVCNAGSGLEQGQQAIDFYTALKTIYVVPWGPT
jgi:hypothetical protein